MPPSPVLLAIDTATSACSVALAVDGHIDEAMREVGQRHTEHVLAMVGEVLARHSLALETCDAIAFGAGPGSFTGLRVACGVAQGLAYGIDKPVIPIDNLAAAAGAVAQRHPEAKRIAVAQDARMNEIYAGLYVRTDSGIAELVAPRLALPADVLQLAADHGADMLVGSALAESAELQAFAGRRLAGTFGTAAAVARLALAALAAGAIVAPEAAAPIYVRDRVAMTVEERRARDNPVRVEA